MVMFTQVQHVRAYQRVVAQIEEAILGGDLVSGGHLPSERDLVEQFGVSRSTIREAMRVLESAGLVSSRPGDPNGARVMPLTTDNLSKSMSMIARRQDLGLVDLLQFRMLIEGNVAEVAARVGTAAELAVMRMALESMRDAVGEGSEAFSEADLAFHRAIAAAANPLLQACGEVILGLVIQTVCEKLRKAPDVAFQMAESLARHEAVLAAIEAGDATEAARLSRLHQLEYYGSFVTDELRYRLERLI